MEYSVGRASQKSIAKSFHVLEKKGQKWHIFSYVAMVGNYLLVMFYTTIAGWMLAYFVKMLNGDFIGLNPSEVNNVLSVFKQIHKLVFLDDLDCCDRLWNLCCWSSTRC